MQGDIDALHKKLMIVDKSDRKYGTKLADAARMPPDKAMLINLPSSLPDLDAIENQLEKKLKRYPNLLVGGNAGY